MVRPEHVNRDILLEELIRKLVRAFSRGNKLTNNRWVYKANGMGVSLNGFLVWHEGAISVHLSFLPSGEVKRRLPHMG